MQVWKLHIVADNDIEYRYIQATYAHDAIKQLTSEGFIVTAYEESSNHVESNTRDSLADDSSRLCSDALRHNQPML